MLAAERGAAANTLAAYRRDLESAEAIIGPLTGTSRNDLARLARAWADLAPSSLARKCSALRQCFGFLVDEGWRGDDPSPALPRPRTRRPLPRILGHGDVEALFATAEAEAAGDKPEAVRLKTVRANINRKKRNETYLDGRLTGHEANGTRTRRTLTNVDETHVSRNERGR